MDHLVDPVHPIVVPPAMPTVEEIANLAVLLPAAPPTPPDVSYNMEFELQALRTSNAALNAELAEYARVNSDFAIACTEITEENKALTAQRIVDLREIDDLKEDCTDQRQRRRKTVTQIDGLQDHVDRLEAYLGFIKLPFSDEDHFSLEASITAIKRQILAQGITLPEAAEHLHHGIRSLPEENTLGDYVEFLTNHLNEDTSGVFALRKTMLLQHQKRIAEYLATTGCFYCNCGRCLNDHVKNRSSDLYHLCPRCLVTPYCNIACAARFQVVHALVCNPHPAWKSDDLRQINYCGFVPLITSAIKQARSTLPAYPPILNPSPTTFGETAITLMSGTERHWTKSKHGVYSLSAQGWRPIKTPGTSVNKWSHEATGKVVWIIDETLPRIHYVNVDRPLEHVNTKDELVVYTQSAYDAMRDKHASNMEQITQLRLSKEEAKKAAARERKLLAQANHSILSGHAHIPKKQRTSGKTEVPTPVEVFEVIEESPDEKTARKRARRAEKAALKAQAEAASASSSSSSTPGSSSSSSEP